MQDFTPKNGDFASYIDEMNRGLAARGHNGPHLETAPHEPLCNPGGTEHSHGHLEKGPTPKQQAQGTAPAPAARQVPNPGNRILAVVMAFFLIVMLACFAGIDPDDDNEIWALAGSSGMFSLSFLAWLMTPRWRQQ